MPAVYNTVPSVATGDWITAGWVNTYIGGNLSAVWPYDTAGQIAYALSANELTALDIGADYKVLQAISGAPVWGGLHSCQVTHNTTQNVNTGSPTALAFNTEVDDAHNWHDNVSNNSRITVPATGYYIASAWLEYAGAGGSPTLYWDTVEIRKNGTVWYDNRKLNQVDAFSKKFCVTTPKISMTAGQYLEVFLEQTSGATRAVQAGATFLVWRVQ